MAQASGLDFGRKSYGFDDVLAIAQRSERLGYDGVVYCDHVYFGQSPYPETWTTLTALATQIKRVKVGTHVACYNYHPPPVVAKLAANVDQISNGRFIFGIGACGWGQEVEHPTYGLRLLKPSDRIERLREAVLVIRKMFTEEAPSFQGKYFKINNARLDPKPVQKPLPIWIGGSGPKLLQVAAELADGWDTGFARPADYDKMLAQVEDGCGRFGRSPGDIRRGFSSYQSIIAPNSSALEEAKRKFFVPLLENKRRHHIDWVRNMAEDEYTDRRFSMGGTPEDVVSKIEAFVKKGVRHFFFSFADFPSTSMLETFAKKVIPEFRQN